MTRGFKPKPRVTLASVAEKIREAPPAPSGISRDAAAVWNLTAPPLAKAGLLHDGNLATLESYCIAVAVVRQCDRSIGKEGAFHKVDGKLKAHPGLAIIAEQTRAVRIFASHLGIAEPREKGGGPKASLEDDDDGLGDL
jgi:P27 family predicted phage terminase small subunit